MLMVRFDNDRQKLSSAMQLVVPGGAREALVVHVNRAVDDDVARRCAETSYLGVIAHLEDQRISGRAVGARLEEQRVPLGAELVRDLLAGDRIHGRLDLALRHTRREDVDVRAQVGSAWHLRWRRGCAAARGHERLSRPGWRRVPRARPCGRRQHGSAVTRCRERGQQARTSADYMARTSSRHRARSGGERSCHDV